MLLILDTVSKKPSVALSKNGSIFASASLIEDRQNGRYETALFVNQIFRLFEAHKIEIDSVSDFIFCAGPGAFSPIRVAIVFARVLKRAKPLINMYQCNLMHLLLSTKKFQDKNSICIKAGLQGYFQSARLNTFSDVLADVQVKLVNNLGDSDYLLSDQEFQETDFVVLMQGLFLNNNQKQFKVDLEEIKPSYFKEASITVSKKKPIL